MTAELPTTEQRLATLEVRVAAIETKLLGLRKLTAAQATKNDRAPDSWTRIEDCLKRSVECWVFRGHEGCWVFARFLIVLALAGLAARGHYYLASAVALTLRCCRGYRLPEPTRQAHLHVNQLRLADKSDGADGAGTSRRLFKER